MFIQKLSNMYIIKDNEKFGSIEKLYWKWNKGEDRIKNRK